MSPSFPSVTYGKLRESNAGAEEPLAAPDLGPGAALPLLHHFTPASSALANQQETPAEKA
eukprot:CAMPEP_0179003756 /NCGR_PEP_ID=MMETSP0795-20121207/12884_1 /TAXON_ID=88552 /ORGANISM="Amoebophrya sp., Strain Ameob2" /LENGTH=59 /DNA_ID=CAMNT_0020697859 /DNA_START=457 /DNA_END=633 /DNA_ORIENTATION=-